MSFETPTETECLRAIGTFEGLSDYLKCAFDPGTDFEAIPEPGANDWLTVHREPGQTFVSFSKSRVNRPDKVRNKLYLQPLGKFPESSMPMTELFKEFAEAYFTMEVVVLPPLKLADGTVTTRINEYTNARQLLTGDILTLLKKKLPDDAFCLLGVTMDDLYPDPSWNFVFGEASLRERVGVYSFIRYDPASYGSETKAGNENIILRRSCKVLAHETVHMFGLFHCIYFMCNINGSNHLAESDSRPIRMCPVCLRKLHHSIGFDIKKRYGTLLKFYEKAGFEDEAEWIKKRLEKIAGSS